VALAHGTGASTKASLPTQIQAALRTIATMVLDQNQLGVTHQATELVEAMVLDQLQHGVTHQATELVEAMVLDQHQHGETLSTQSVHAPDGVANHLIKNTLASRGYFYLSSQ
jgi:hypothetical protein